MTWNVIWQVDPNDLLSCIERDWFYEVTSFVPIHSVQVDYKTKPLLQLTLPYSIICASCPNQTDKSDLIQYLNRLPRPRVLYHMSDEYVRVGRELYQHCELVIRNGSADFAMFDDPRFVQIPLGYVSGLRNSSGAFQNASQRKCSFAFFGAIKHDRGSEMLGALRKLGGQNFVRTTQSFATATRRFDNSTITVYKNTVFVPNPKGNWNPECNRLYDALEWGCIPLIRRYADTAYHENYHDKLLGRHPIPTFDDWGEAADFAAGLLADKATLDDLQAKIFAWWQNYKSQLQAKVAHKFAELAR
jgi:hypothetical protein